jgi:transposase
MWAPIGEQAKVPITGEHDRCILTGVLNIKTGDYLQYASSEYKQAHFQEVLHLTRAHWRGWHIVLFLDKVSAQWALASRKRARELGIELRWLPKACPELNPVDHLWRHLEQDVLANDETPDMNETLKNAQDYLASLSPRQRLRKAGVLSENFWLADVLNSL